MPDLQPLHDNETNPDQLSTIINDIRNQLEMLNNLYRYEKFRLEERHGEITIKTSAGPANPHSFGFPIQFQIPHEITRLTTYLNDLNRLEQSSRKRRRAKIANAKNPR